MNSFRNSLMGKLVLSFIVAGVIFTCCTTYVLQNMFIRVLYKQQESAYEGTVRHVMDYIDLVVYELKSTCNQASYLPSFSSEDRNEIAQSLQNFLNQNSEGVRRWYYIDDQGQMYSSHQVILEVLQKTMDYDLPRRIASDAPRNGSVALSDVYRSSMITDHTIAVYRRITGSGASGTVMAEISLEHLADKVNNAFGVQSVNYVLFSGQGNRICQNLNQAIAEMEEDVGKEPLLPGWSEFHTENGMHLRVYTTSGLKQCDWQLMLIVDETQAYNSLSRLVYTILLACILLLSGLVISLVILAGHFVRPIRRLSQQMEEIDMEGGTIAPFEPIRTKDEIGDLSGSIGRMLDRMRTMMANQREIERHRYESELKALQHQFSPHFLYNTLNMLSSLVISGKADQVPAAVSALVHILLMGTDKIGPAITLEEELRCSEEFMRIMSLRYGDQLDLSVNVPEADKKCLVPKLVLQPIIENCFFHGFSQQSAHALIVIESCMEDGDLCLTVLDNGIGIPSERLEHLFDEKQTGNLKSTGLINTDTRIRILFGPRYGLRIHSQAGVGTKAKIRLPRMISREEWEEKTR